MTYSNLLKKQKAFYHSRTTLDVNYRIQALENLRLSIQKKEDQILQALKIDLNKSDFESYSSEVGVILQEIRFVLKHLRSWTKPQKVKTPLTHIGSRSYIQHEPYGVALIIAPWNYPFQLSLAPLIGAIAAGNCAFVKPSELTPNTADLIDDLIQETFPQDYITVVKGGVDTSQELLSLPFDKIFFTGSTHVGKIVMEKASKHLTPVSLELGGKSPCIIHEDANVKLAAKRTAWGKYLNAGQTCIAPDYLLVHQNIKEELLFHLKKSIQELYGEQPIRNENYTHIVNKNHYNRLSSFLSDGEVVIGGNCKEEDLVIEPTVLMSINWNDPIMQEEIFGPILPVIEYQNIHEVIEGIQQHPNPLALYMFTNDKQVQHKVSEEISFGGGCINDTVYHFVSPHLPFGGVRSSGLGAYHGKASFDTFSHQKSLLKQTIMFDLPFRYPNFKNGLKRIKYFLN